MNTISNKLQEQNYQNVDVLHANNDEILGTLDSIANISTPSKVYYQTVDNEHLGRFYKSGGELAKIGGSYLESAVRSVGNLWADWWQKSPESKVSAEATVQKLELVEHCLDTHLKKIEMLNLNDFSTAELHKVYEETNRLLLKLQTSSIGLANMRSAYSDHQVKAAGFVKEEGKYKSIMERASVQKAKVEAALEHKLSDSFYKEKRREITIPLLTLKGLTLAQEIAYDPKSGFSYVLGSERPEMPEELKEEMTSLTYTKEFLLKAADAATTYLWKNNTAVIEGLFKLTNNIDSYAKLAAKHETKDAEFVTNRLNELNEFNEVLDNSSEGFKKIKDYYTQSYGPKHRVNQALDKLSEVKGNVNEAIQILTEKKVELEKNKAAPAPGVFTPPPKPANNHTVGPAGEPSSVQSAPPPPLPPPSGKAPPPPPPPGKGALPAAGMLSRRDRERLALLSNPDLLYKGTVDEAKLAPIQSQIAQLDENIMDWTDVLKDPKSSPETQQKAEANISKLQAAKKRNEDKLAGEKSKGIQPMAAPEFAHLLTHDYPTAHLKLLFTIISTDPGLSDKIKGSSQVIDVDQVKQGLDKINPQVKAAYEQHKAGWIKLLENMSGAGFNQFLSVLKTRIEGGENVDVPMVKPTKSAPPTTTAKKLPITPKAPVDPAAHRKAIEAGVLAGLQGLRKVVPREKTKPVAAAPVEGIKPKAPPSERVAKVIPKKEKSEFDLRSEFLTAKQLEFNRDYNRKDRELIQTTKVGFEQTLGILSGKARIPEEEALWVELQTIKKRKNAINDLMVPRLEPDYDPTADSVYLPFLKEYGG